MNRSADIMRGGLKLGAGVLSVGAGACSVTLDWLKAKDTWARDEDRAPALIYGLRSVTGGASSVFTALGAFSYCQPAMQHMAKSYAVSSSRNRALLAAGKLAAKLAKRVWLLVWAARLNWLGLGLTVAEIGYLYLRDDELQNWCEKSAFRKVKVRERYDAGNDWLGIGVAGGTAPTDHFTDPAQELEALDRAAEAVGL